MCALLPWVAEMNVAAEPSEQWYLMSRHGECAEITSLQRKVSDLGTLEDPDSFIAEMQSRGHRVIQEPLPLARGSAVQVDVPALSLSLVFVTTELCSAFTEGPR